MVIANSDCRRLTSPAIIYFAYGNGCTTNCIKFKFFYFPSTTITISPFGFLSEKWVISSAKVPRTVSS